MLAAKCLLSPPLSRVRSLVFSLSRSSLSLLFSAPRRRRPPVSQNINKTTTTKHKKAKQKKTYICSQSNFKSQFKIWKTVYYMENQFKICGTGRGH
jgi:hypothetical protein